MNKWTRFLLMFRRAQTSIDIDRETGYATKLTFKRMGGRIYVLNETRYIPPPEHFNCRCVVTPKGWDER